GARAALLTAPIHLRADPPARLASADVERADALRAVHLVRGDARKVDVHLLYVERHLADALNRVGVEEDPARPGDLADLLDRLDRPDLVVREHDRDEDRLFRHRPL